ncbi:MAG: hypothetical protein FJX76_26450 [Armatimonadetes bacterium]|nr:hypothetical protein [Armatimonadota bacterium]
MNVPSTFTAPPVALPVAARPLSAASNAIGDSVTLTGTTDADKTRKAYKALAWGGFATQCAGAALVLAGHGGVGIAVFAAGSAAIVYGEWKAKH